MMHLDQLRENMKVVGSDGEAIGIYLSLSGQLMKISEAEAQNSHHFLDVGLIKDVAGNSINLLVSSDEARERWSEEE